MYFFPSDYILNPPSYLLSFSFCIVSPLTVLLDILLFFLGVCSFFSLLYSLRNLLCLACVFDCWRKNKMGVSKYVCFSHFIFQKNRKWVMKTYNFVFLKGFSAHGASSTILFSLFSISLSQCTVHAHIWANSVP